MAGFAQPGGRHVRDGHTGDVLAPPRRAAHRSQRDGGPREVGARRLAEAAKTPRAMSDARCASKPGDVAPADVCDLGQHWCRGGVGWLQALAVPA